MGPSTSGLQQLGVKRKCLDSSSKTDEEDRILRRMSIKKEPSEEYVLPDIPTDAVIETDPSSVPDSNMDTVINTEHYSVPDSPMDAVIKIEPSSVPETSEEPIPEELSMELQTDPSAEGRLAIPQECSTESTAQVTSEE
ncbi:hypothetical protein AVEN_186159-1 [Araneus ventricosus]|uniref:Uncharacterized protein n=1 Tax=Araneus ventricosus TaxID=182803 RepID=A0A4Y2GEQ0_ARAVE|nr:hypothetical protein AVEN_186159-1 [Araneus ventricosus]